MACCRELACNPPILPSPITPNPMLAITFPRAAQRDTWVTRYPSIRVEEPTGDAFTDHDGGEVGVGTGNHRHDRAIGDEHVVQPMDPAPGVGDSGGIVGCPHRAGT